MIIEFNTDHNVTASEEFRSPLIALITEKLSRIDHHVTRLDVHLKDENGNKGGLNDKRCMIEAHVEEQHPVAVTNHGDSYEQAVAGAIDKLKSSLNSLHGRLNHH